MTTILIKKPSYKDLRDRLFPLSPINNAKIPPIKTNTHLGVIELTEIINGFIELIKEEFHQTLTILTQQPLPEDNNKTEFSQMHQELSSLANEIFYLYLNLEDCRISQDQNWPTKISTDFSGSNC